MNLKRIKRQIIRWWVGEFIPYENDPNSIFQIIGGRYRRHWSAVALRAAINFFAREWKWCITFTFGLAGLVMTYLRFFWT